MFSTFFSSAGAPITTCPLETGRLLLPKKQKQNSNKAKRRSPPTTPPTIPPIAPLERPELGVADDVELVVEMNVWKFRVTVGEGVLAVVILDMVIVGVEEV